MKVFISNSFYNSRETNFQLVLFFHIKQFQKNDNISFESEFRTTNCNFESIPMHFKQEDTQLVQFRYIYRKVENRESESQKIDPGVVYFDQRMGASHAVRWSKSNFLTLIQLFPSLTEENKEKFGRNTQHPRPRFTNLYDSGI